MPVKFLLSTFYLVAIVDVDLAVRVGPVAAFSAAPSFDTVIVLYQ